MDRRYDAYCATDPLFYDSLAGDGERGRDFPIASRPVPQGWKRESVDDWLIYGPDQAKLPRQGWKIHVSGCLDNAERILDAIWEYCVPRGISFKYLRSPRVMLMRNSKYAARAASGKLVTIYPTDEDALATILTDLDAKLSGEPGPYILSDLRYGDGPLYVRYGGFAHLFCLSDTGEMVPALVGPDGTFEPDRRQATFAVPEWVTLPEILRPHLAARNATTVADLPYRIDEVLHYSNAGGLYAAEDTRTGERVVLKEARPHAGLDGHGEDAVARLRREHRMLDRVADAGVTPRVHDAFVLGEHEFVALEFIEGQPLNSLVVQRYPLVDANADDATRAEYTAWARDIYDQVERAVHALHDRGVVYGDLHLFNIMVRPDGRIALLDFEVAADRSETQRPGLRNQGFAAPRDRVGVAVDEYALACLKLSLFLPLTPLLRLDPAKARHLASVIGENFPIEPEFLADSVEVIAPGQAEPNAEAIAPGQAEPDSQAGSRPQPQPPWPTFPADPDAWPSIRESLTRAMLASATPQRQDRLFPGDIAQFRVGGLNIAYGAAGVLYALAESGVKIDPEHHHWLVERAKSPAFDARYGFLDGLHGVAYVLDRLDDRPAALDVMERCVAAEGWQRLGLDLSGGLAGIGLNLRYFADATGEPEFAEQAARTVDLVADRFTTTTPDAVPEISGGSHPRAGLVHGSSGPALLLIRAYDATGDGGYLDAAATALRQDLRRCVARPDGALEVNEGWRTMPYLADGSLGIGLVLDEYLARRHDEAFETASRAIALAAHSPLYVQSGLFAGRAGVVAYLATAADRGRGRSADRADDRVEAELDRQIARLVWHGMPYRGGIAFPGDQLLRLSMDLATGTAGVLLAIAAARHDRPVHLPALGPAPMTTAR